MTVKQLFDIVAPNCAIRVRALRIMSSDAGWLGAIEYLQIYSKWDLEPLKSLEIVHPEQQINNFNFRESCS